MPRFNLLILFLLLQTFSKAQSPVDVLQYGFNLQLTDASDTLKGTAVITVKFLENRDSFSLNLASVKKNKGMQVQRVISNGKTFSNTHINDSLIIYADPGFEKDSVRTFSIMYTGVPADGLIISKNKYGERTFFADNWPNRAQQWLPCNDRPDDKATVEFEVIAPAHYQIISNGVLVSEKDTSDGQRITHWKEEIPIPTKVMVIGAARFAVKQFSDSISTPVSAWAYPQDSTKGFYDYALAPSIVTFFSDYIGPYPFEKLANVQSKTIFGGMENAGAIFYGEKTVTGDRTSEALLAHEIAHQWFGNSATEKSFAHVWLSEGFATYLTNIYLEQKYGSDTLRKRLQEDRNDIIKFSKEWNKPVVDSSSGLMELLNANSYQKGGWVLHMLRQEVGDSIFQNIIRSYYDRYKFSNADTWDFEKVAEDVSGKDLKWFFEQWLYTPGVPELFIQLQIAADSVKFKIIQHTGLYRFSLEVGMIDAAGKMTIQTIPVHEKETDFIFKRSEIKKVVVDPNTKLLYTEVRRHTIEHPTRRLRQKS